ncbi:MAG: primosomal protein N' [Fibrobacteraceae bacterium]|nr:primosomal protein N' [Fibrobacteraceae bacterium]
MAKRIPKTSAPEEVKAKFKASALNLFCEVYIPGAPSVFTYGVSQSAPVNRGSVVWIQLATRKKPSLAVVSRVLKDRPAFDVRCAYPHQSGYCFSERYMEILEWVSRYYMSTPMKSLDVFWPADFEKFLDVLVAENSLNNVDNTDKLPTNPQGPALTEEQRNVLDSMMEELAKPGFRGVLLHGVTGSGKTRVYQELTFEALKQGKKVLILVPEIGLTPQTSKRFEDYLQVGVQVLHSALSAPQKRAAYVSVLKGEARVVLGTRSAILSPFDFDLVILDEEHDGSFKQQDPSPRYHTRELAFHIAHKYGAMVVLGSATPSLETYHNAKAGHLKLLQLKKRATATELPQVQVVDMGQVRQQKGIMLSPLLRDALVESVASKNQSIVLMNRRGYSKIRVCGQCGETLYCKQCHVPLVYHKQHHSLLCHYCNLLYPVDSPCFACGCETYEFVGGAIEKLEEEIMEWVPGAKIVRMDRDTTQNVGATEKILDSFRNREYNILLGTQMVAKGHDFPGVQLVGVVGADSSLGVPDFRGDERLYQLLSQTAGRAGRAQGGGKVIIQTLNPNNAVMQFAIRHDYEGFAQLERENRLAAFYPPFCKLVSISVGCKDECLLRQTVSFVESRCRSDKSLMVFGPVDAFIAMVQNVHWVKLYIKTKDLNGVRKILSPIVNNPKGVAPGVDIKVELE